VNTDKGEAIEKKKKTPLKENKERPLNK